MILPITAYGNPLLRKVSTDIEVGDQSVKQLIDDMFETMYRSDGVGLAAPQIGKSIRLFVLDCSAFAEDEPACKDFKKAFINPVIEEEWGNGWMFNEGCLSLPDIHEDVKRPSDLRITYYDENWEKHTEEYNGYRARVIQHEYDHLQGKMFIDHLSAIRKRLIKGKLTAIEKGKIQTSYRISFYKK